MEKHWIHTRFGEAPFKEVKLFEFTFSGPKAVEDIAFLQYELLTKKEVLQAHLNFASKKGKVVVLPGFELKKELEKMGLDCKFESEETISYEYFLSRNNMV